MARPTKIRKESPALEVQTPPGPPPAVNKLAGPATWVDDRIGLAKLAGNIRKIFPDHWSFLLGEIALYSFVILLLTGVFLTLWFKPSMGEVEYAGSYELMHNIPMSEAFASTLNISFDIRGGLLMRQVHHWAAMLFVASMTVHLLRIFFTGAFRKPRELNWIIGVGMFSIALIEGFAGYSLPDDLLSGTGLRFVDGSIRSIPIVGTWVEFLVFGGEFPGELIIPRLYMVHILLVPGLLLGLISAHMALLVYHKHTQWPAPGRTQRNIQGYPFFPIYVAKAGGFFFIVFGITTLMGALMQINPVWLFGPYNPSQVTAGSQPDWYMGFVEGAIRIMPNWEWHLGPTTWSWNIFIPFVGLMGLLFTGLALYPFIEAWITGDRSEHHLLDRPRNVPNRTAFGVACMTCYAMFWMAGGNDIIATTFHVSLNAVTYFMRVAVFVMPVIAFIITKRVCLSLQRHDAETVLHGSPTGVIVRSPDGGYTEAHQPIDQGAAYTLTRHQQWTPVEKGPKLRQRLSRWFAHGQIAKPTTEEIEASRHHSHPISPVDAADETAAVGAGKEAE